MNLKLGRLCAFFIAFCLCFVSNVANAAIIYTNANETQLNTSSSNPVDSGTVRALNDNCQLLELDTFSPGYHVDRVTSPVRAGTYAQIQTLQKGCDYRSSNPVDYQKPRVGMIPKRTVIAPTVGNEYWVAMSVYIPADWQTETLSNREESLFQLFKDSNRDDGAWAFGVIIDRDQLELTNWNGGASGATRETYSVTFEKGVWYDIVFHFKIDDWANGDDGGFYNIYLDWPNNPNDPTVPVATGTGPNTFGADHSVAFNLYKPTGYCLSAYQLKPLQCPYNAAGGYPLATNTETNWTGKRTLYFDEVRIGNSASSLAEVAPHFNTTAPPTDPVAIVSMNQGAALTANKPADSTSAATFFTTENGDTSGVSRVSISDGVNSEDALAVNSNASGGLFSTGALSTLSGGPVTVSVEYDNPQFDSEITTSGEVYNWTDSSATSTAYTSTFNQDYGYLDGAKVCNTGASYGFTISPETTIATGRTVTVRAVAKGDTSNTMRMFVRARSGGTNKYTSVRGTFGALYIDAVQHGTGHTLTETVHNGLSFIEFSFVTNEVDYEYAVTFGPNSNTSGVCMVALGARLWDNESVSTLTYNTTLDKPDTLAPNPSNCQLGAVSTTSASLGCDLDDATGTFYAVITTSSTAPSLAQCKAGQDHTGAAALWSSSQTATSGTFTASNLDPYTDKYAYFCQTDAAANDSSVVAAETNITGETPVTKSVKFNATHGRLKRGGALFSGTFGNIKIYTELPWKDPAATVLAHAESVTVTSGEVTLTDASLCATNCGSINALEAATDYAFVAYDSDDDPYAFGYIQITVE